jgi:quercetin dioxygenase-like cupin family protein
MMNRRDALVAASQAHAQSKGGAAAAPAPIFTHDLPNLTMDDWQVTVSLIEQKPGSIGHAHQHPGFVLVYVLEGQVVTKISGQPERTYSAGEVFYEQPGSTHEVSNNPSKTQAVKFVAFIFARKGLPLVKPV